MINTGGHFGRDKTYEKVASKFYWKNMYEDVTKYVRCCHHCQTVNDKFCKPNAQLHPIKVEPGFWKMVCSYQVQSLRLHSMHPSIHPPLTVILLPQVGIDLIGPLPSTPIY